MASDESTTRDLDAPSPPGGPLRQDAPAGNVTVQSNDPPPPTTEGTDPVPTEPGPASPGGPSQPHVEPSSTPDGPQIIPSPSTPEGEPGPDPAPETAPATAPDPESARQFQNAESSTDEPSDNSGAE